MTMIVVGWCVFLSSPEIGKEQRYVNIDLTGSWWKQVWRLSPELCFVDRLSTNTGDFCTTTSMEEWTSTLQHKPPWTASHLSSIWPSPKEILTGSLWNMFHLNVSYILEGEVPPIPPGGWYRRLRSKVGMSPLGPLGRYTSTGTVGQCHQQLIEARAWYVGERFGAIWIIYFPTNWGAI